MPSWQLCNDSLVQRGRGDGGSMVTTAGVDNKDPEALVEEEQRMRQLRMLVTVTTAVIQNRPLSRREAEQAVEELRKQAMKLFPDKGEVFDLIYRPRFHRLIDQRFSA